MTCMFIKRPTTCSVDRSIERPIAQFNAFLMNHETIRKVTVATMHIFRAAMMWTFCAMLPFTPATSFLLGTAASLGYFASIEYGNCTYRFSVLACAGAFAYHLSAPALALIVNGLALASIKTFVNALLGSIPAILYLISVAWISNASVNDSKKLDSCCCAPQSPMQTNAHSLSRLRSLDVNVDIDDFDYTSIHSHTTAPRVPEVNSPE